MIRLAANYSQPLLSLMDEHPGVVSAVKVSEFDRPEYLSDYADLAARDVPLVLHGLAQNVTPGTPAFRSEFDPAKLRLALSLCQPSYISVHLEWRCREPFPGRDDFLRELARDIGIIRDLTGLPVHLENVFYSPGPNRPYLNPPLIGDPDLICGAVRANSAHFLLDLGHAQIAAWHRNEGAESYVRRLPLASVREIHLSGPAMVDGMLADKHMEVDAEGYALLQTTLRCATAETVSLEYGGVGPIFAGKTDREALYRQLVKLRRLIDISAAGSDVAGSE